MWWALQRHLSDALTPYIAQLNYVNGASGRNRTGMPAMNEATDFKSMYWECGILEIISPHVSVLIHIDILLLNLGESMIRNK